jgi:hypothetical protein
MSGFTQIPTEQELNQLPPMAIAVYAVRNALRIRPLYAPTSHCDSESYAQKRAIYQVLSLCVEAVSQAVVPSDLLRQQITEAATAADATAEHELAWGRDLTGRQSAGVAKVIAQAGRAVAAALGAQLGSNEAKHRNITLAANLAAEVARQAAQVVDEVAGRTSFVAAARRDYDQLRRLTGDGNPQNGWSIDPESWKELGGVASSTPNPD